MCVQGVRVEEACPRRPGRGRAPELPAEYTTACVPRLCDCGFIDSANRDAACARQRTAMEHSHGSLSARGGGEVADGVDTAGVAPEDTHHTSAVDVGLARARLARRLAGLGSESRTAGNPEADTGPGRQLHQPDALGRATQAFKRVLQRAGCALEACKGSPYYSALSRTTQPAHIVTFAGVALLAMLLFPHHDADADRHDAPSQWTYLAYVVAFAAHFGSQFWMTFVSGLSLFFSLPRHHFAEVQKVLFPLYFAINAGLSLVTLAAFLRLQSGWSDRWDAELCLQVLSMAACFLLELLVRMYLTPPLLQLITAKTEMEKTVDGVGQEVGRYDLGPLTHCPHYVKIHGAFRKVHTHIAMANIVAMGCTALHAHYLAHKICL